MSLARFMELGLMHPEHGYYSTRDKIFNKGGDFTTSPEISQMFGEMLGIWIMTAIRNNYMKVDDTTGEPSGEVSSVNLVEIGPGSGLMMSDIIRVSLYIGKVFARHSPNLQATSRTSNSTSLKPAPILSPNNKKGSWQI